MPRRDGKARVLEVKTQWSRVLGKYIEIQTLEEEDVLYILDQIDLADLSYEEYKLVILKAWPGTAHHFADLPKLRLKRAIDEVWPLVLDTNPILAPEHIIKHEIIQTKPRKTAIGDKKPEAALPKAAEKPVEATKPLEPPSRPSVADIKDLVAEVREGMGQMIIGQDQAVDQVMAALGKSMLRKDKSKRPIASLFFAGQSGVGKTEVARQLAIALGGDEDRLLQINCGEYAEAHTAARLVGAPPGYIGYEGGGILQNKVKKDGKVQVLLFDEFEKAHSRLQSLLLAAMEDGFVDAGNGVRIDLSQCVIILTSNIGAELWRKITVGFKPSVPASVHNEVIAKLRKELPVEFINRLSSVIVFNDLKPEHLSRIATLQMERMRERVDHLVKLDWDESTITYLITDLPEGMGARPIRTRVETMESGICTKLLTQIEFKQASLSVDDGVKVTTETGDTHVIYKNSNK